MNLKNQVNAFRQQIMDEAILRNGHPADDLILRDASEAAARVTLAYQEMCDLRNLVGRMPPSPNTLRARAGGLLIHLVQRMLFWYTPQIQQFNASAATVLETVCCALDEQLTAMRRLLEEVERLRAEARLYSAGGTPAPVDAPASANGRSTKNNNSGFETFVFAMQDELRGPCEQFTSELRHDLEILLGLNPPLPAGPWLDLGCGRGDWLSLVQAAGLDSTGVDSSLAATSHCRELGLTVCHADLLEYLKDIPESSFAVISAFHTFEKYRFDYIFEAVKLSVRALKSGGVFILQSADPSNLLVGAHDFWRDPVNQRPLPPLASQRLLEHFGLRIIAQRTLSPVPEQKQLPFAELDLVRQLNSVLYGHRAHVILGRRDGAVPTGSRAWA